MNRIEILGFGFAIIGIWLNTRQIIWCWLLTIISSICYFFYFIELKLYADSLLQLFFVVMGIFGWINWKKIKAYQQQVYSWSNNQLILCTLMVVSATLFLGGFLKIYTDASLPFLDSFCLGLSLTATWLSAKKVIENWVVWIFVDFIYVGIYIFKDAYLTAVLYTILIILAVIGYRSWKKTQVQKVL